MLNRTVARLTARGLLGGRRMLLLLALSLLLPALATMLRLALGVDHEVTASLLGVVALGTMVPLLCLIVGTGAIGPEIDDGSVVYLLSKPVPRAEIVRSKLVVAVVCAVAFGAVPTLVAGLIMSETGSGIAVAFGVAALVASTAYCAIFMLLAVVSRHAVVIGLVYALLWESLVGSFVPGARALSVQQWALTVAETIADDGVIIADVALPTAVVLLAVVSAAATWYAGQRLRVLALTGEA
ncbi:MAG: ABC transporter permease subunit [Jiangellaceae bacterium]